MEDGQEAPLKPSMSYTILLVKIGLQINSTNRFIDQNKNLSRLWTVKLRVEDVRADKATKLPEMHFVC